MYNRATGRPPISGISIESVDGGDIDGVTISNISIVNVQTPIFLRLGNRGRDMDKAIPGKLRNVLITNIVATGAKQPCPIVGIPDHKLENITLDNIQITYTGGGTLEQTNIQVPEYENKYPEATMFDTLPSYGLYCRHVKGLKLQDINLNLQSPDYRHALICDDVSRAIIDSFDAHQSKGAESVIRFQGVKQAMICRCMPSEEIFDFIKVRDGGMDEIKFVGNDFRRKTKTNNRIRENTMSSQKSNKTIPIFVQTAFPEQPELDRWRQVTEKEAQIAYDMTLRNELSGGTPTVREFEKAWREWTQLKHAITTCNGSTALYCAYFGLGIGPGDEIICPTYTWICTIAPALFLGARPVFVESDPETLQIDPEDVLRKITPKTRAIVAVHIWGNVCDMGHLMTISSEKGIPLVEDCSHAHGATWNGRLVGTIGHVGAWSLQGTKAVSAGEGGVLATNDSEIFERACLAGQVNRMGGLDIETEKYADLQPLGLGMKSVSYTHLTLPTSDLV